MEDDSVFYWCQWARGRTTYEHFKSIVHTYFEHAHPVVKRRCALFSQPQRPNTEKPAELGMRLSKEVQELFPVTLHQDVLTVILILIKLNKTKTSDKIFKANSRNVS